MNYIVDNTIADPEDATGYTVGSKFLIPTTGGEGLWAGRKDEIATWNGSSWAFSSSFAPGDQYQVTDGPNIHKVYIRTVIPSLTSSLIQNADLALDPALYAQFDLIETAGGTVVWSSVTGFVALNSTTTGDAAKLLVTFIPVVGVRYRLVYVLDTLTEAGPDSFVQWKLRDEVNATDIDSGNLTTNGTYEVEFVAASDEYSFYVQAISSGAAAAAAELDSLGVYRVEEHVTDGDFPDFANWTEVTPWAIASGYPAPFSGNVAEAVLLDADHPYSSFPALEQDITGLVDGWWYQFDFDCNGIWAEGTLSLAIDGEVIHDISTNGHHTVYFRASADNHTLQFPITYFGAPEDFEVQLDNVEMRAALWVPDAVIQGTGTSTSSQTSDLSVSRPGSTVSIAISSATAVMSAIRKLVASASSHSINVVTATKSHVWNLRAEGFAVSSSGVGGSHSRLLVGTGTATSSSEAHMSDLGYYTVQMAVRSILSLWSDLGCPCPDSGACSAIELDALERLNAAIQKLSGAGQNYAWLSTVAMELSPLTGETHITLPRDVLHVKRAVFKPALSEVGDTFGSFPLRPLKTRNECESFRLAYAFGGWPLAESEEYLAGYNLPLAYFVEAEDPRTGDTVGGGPPELTLLLAPDFLAEVPWSVAMQVAILPGRLGCEDLRGGARLPVPHRFTESLVLPLARYYALASRYFRKPELRESVIEQARDALTLIGEYQPLQPEAAKAPATPTTSAR